MPSKGSDYPTFHETVVQSPEWKKWEVQQNKWFRMKKFDKCYDMAEVVECGWISSKHFSDFLKFCRRVK